MNQENVNAREVALILDELSNKVIGYKTSGFYSTDIIVNDVLLNTINEASYNEQDVYFVNGELVVCEKDPNEYWNKINAINNDISDSQVRLKKLFIEFMRNKSINVSYILQELTKKNEKLKIQRDLLNGVRDLRIKNKLIKDQHKINYKYYCSICLIIRDESEYLKEWLEWHIGQGIEHFYIYDHGSKQPVSEFIATLDSKIQSKVTVTYFGGSHVFAQHDAYNDCLNRYKFESRWIAYVDADEMIRVKNGKLLPELLKNYEDFAGLFIRWVVYGANGQVEKSKLPLRMRFTKITPCNRDYGTGKVIVQPLFMRYMLTHNGFPVSGFKVVDEQKSPVAKADGNKWDSTDDLICLDHYYTKSYKEWVEKISRGTCDPYYNRKYEEFFEFNPDMEYCREEIYPKQEYEISKK